MTNHRYIPRRRLDVASLILTVVGLVFGVFSYLLIVHGGVTPLLLVPSVIALTIGATHLVKHEAPR
ncbi:hypothetical protein D3226_05840 [Leucobacter chromiireducens subsp. chromiireducens]|uniref:Permease n=1 Tax=Leucobacter chromiireducens subsp. chromiireducens TaxID=660067 RepID=A0ABS1SMT8_9MICO|nr:hypothetical protein [Leucobacter chromiireducens subsp. chromiireducens]